MNKRSSRHAALMMSFILDNEAFPPLSSTVHKPTDLNAIYNNASLSQNDDRSFIRQSTNVAL